MAYEVIMPKQGLQMTEGTIMKWLVPEGGQVREGEPLFEMETDKLTITIDAPRTGTLLKIVHPEGDTVPITQVIALIGEPGERPEAPVPAAASDETRQPPAARDEKPAAQAPVPVPPPLGRRVTASPAARTLAEREKLNLDGLAGSGPEGLVIRRDVEALIARKAAVLPAAVREETAAPARTIKDSLIISAQASCRATADMTALAALREKLKAQEVRVSVGDLFVRIVSRALVEHPAMNGADAAAEAGSKPGVHMGIAVALPEGFAVPVVRNAHEMPLRRIAEVSSDLSARAQTGTLGSGEYEGATFTIADFGIFGVDESTAAVTPPQRGILALGRIARAPVAAGDRMEIRPVMTMTLSYDHRQVNAVQAVRFLQRVRQLAEDPMLLL